jgi:flavodoxin
MNQVTADKSGSNSGIVIFDSRYGNTEKIARSFETGLKQAGIDTICINAKELRLESLNQFDLIAIGAPTEKITASKSIKEFLEKLKDSNTDFSGKFGFAFDTRFPLLLSGSAAKFIENKLKHLGLEIITPHSSAIVVSHKEAQGGVKLKEGEEERFEQIGVQVGTALLAKKKIIRFV